MRVTFFSTSRHTIDSKPLAPLALNISKYKARVQYSNNENTHSTSAGLVASLSRARCRLAHARAWARCHVRNTPPPTTTGSYTLAARTHVHRTLELNGVICTHESRQQRVFRFKRELVCVCLRMFTRARSSRANTNNNRARARVKPHQQTYIIRMSSPPPYVAFVVFNLCVNEFTRRVIVLINPAQ